MYKTAIERGRRSPPPHEEYEYDAFKIDVHGTRGQSPATTTYNIITWNDPESGIPSSRDTSVPPSIAAYWQATGRIKKPGVYPPEATIDPEPFFAELGKRKIIVREEKAAQVAG
jgi:saccharopine dehydrogenase-like NADP-dependent oxidoreductase